MRVPPESQSPSSVLRSGSSRQLLRWLALVLLKASVCVGQNLDPAEDFTVQGTWYQVWQLKLQQSVRDLSAAGATRVLFLGDSTLRKQQQTLCSAVRRMAPPGVTFSPPSPKAATGRRLTARAGGPPPPAPAPRLGALATCDSRPATRTLCSWGNISFVYTCNYACDWVSPLPVEDLPEFDGTTILYHNCGLHLLQLGQIKPFESLEAFDAAVNLEERLLGVWNTGIEAHGVDALVYMTTHSICEKSFKPELYQALQEYRDQMALSPRPRSWAWCVRYHRAWTASRFDVEAVCRWALYADSGVRTANEIASTALEALQAQRPELAVRVVDAYAMTRNQCWATKDGDGIHFAPLAPLELQYLLEQVRQILAGRAATGAGQ